MTKVNNFLESIVKSAQSVCLEKFNLAQTIPGPNAADLAVLKPDMDRIFTSLAKPDLWNSPTPIDTDGTAIVAQVIALDNVQPTQLNTVAAKIRGILTLLDVSILKSGAQPQMAVAVTSGMNMRILNALRITRQQINIRLQKFTDAGQDLSQDDAFIAMQLRQEHLVKAYREKLTDNLIVGKESDVTIIQLSGNTIANTTTTAIFKMQYNKLNHFIQSQLPRV